jgi:uncharacterized membrane protein YsdA (DUF1294 family)
MKTTKKLHPGWIIMGFILALLGGIPGLLYGIYISTGKYQKAYKRFGVIIVILSLLMTWYWFFGILSGNFLSPF